MDAYLHEYPWLITIQETLFALFAFEIGGGLQFGLNSVEHVCETRQDI